MALTRPKASQIATNTVDFDDPLLRINKSQTGTNDKDIGFVFERGSDTNVALIWDESASQFALIDTAETGSTNGNVNIDGYLSLKVETLDTANLTINDAYSFPTLDGTENQVLSTNGSGSLTFVDVATTLDAVTDNGNTTTNSISVGDITVSGNILPATDEIYSLGTSSLKFSTLHVASSTVFLGDNSLSIVNQELYLNGNPVAGAGDFWPGSNENYDLSKALAQNTSETPFEEGGVDSFGVSLSLVFDNMSPAGSTVTYDYGDGEAYVGA